MTHEEALGRLAAVPACCASPAEFTLSPLRHGEPVVATLDEKSEAFSFPSGKSVFRAFSRPEKALPYYVNVSSWATSADSNEPHLFFPKLVLLDGGGAPLAETAPWDFIVHRTGFAEAAAASWSVMLLKAEGGIRVDDAGPAPHPNSTR